MHVDASSQKRSPGQKPGALRDMEGIQFFVTKLRSIAAQRSRHSYLQNHGLKR